MNTGLQEAHNLACAFADVLVDGMPHARLDRYEAERRPVGRILVATTDRAFGVITSESRLSRFVRGRIVPFAGPVAVRVVPILVGGRRVFGYLSRRASGIGSRMPRPYRATRWSAFDCPGPATTTPRCGRCGGRCTATACPSVRCDVSALNSASRRTRSRVICVAPPRRSGVPRSPRRVIVAEVLALGRRCEARRRPRVQGAAGGMSVPGRRVSSNGDRRDRTPRTRPMPDAASRRRRFAGAATQLGTEVSINFGSSLAGLLIPIVGSFVVVAARQIVMVAVVLPLPPKRAELTWRRLWPALALGVTLAVMNLAFYESVHLLGLGIAATIEFLGPLALALATSRRLLDAGCALAAASGVCAPHRAGVVGCRGDRPLGRGARPDGGRGMGGLHRAHSSRRRRPAGPRGAHRREHREPGAAAALRDRDLRRVGDRLARRALLLGVGVLSSALPYSLDTYILRRITPRLYAIITSFGPGDRRAVRLARAVRDASRRTEVIAIAIVCGAAGTAIATQRERPKSDLEQIARRAWRSGQRMCTDAHPLCGIRDCRTPAHPARIASIAISPHRVAHYKEVVANGCRQDDPGRVLRFPVTPARGPRPPAGSARSSPRRWRVPSSSGTSSSSTPPRRPWSSTRSCSRRRRTRSRRSSPRSSRTRWDSSPARSAASCSATSVTNTAARGFCRSRSSSSASPRS